MTQRHLSESRSARCSPTRALMEEPSPVALFSLPALTEDAKTPPARLLSPPETEAFSADAWLPMPPRIEA